MALTPLSPALPPPGQLFCSLHINFFIPDFRKIRFSSCIIVLNG